MIIEKEMLQKENETRPMYEMRIGLGKIEKKEPYVNYSWDDICNILNIQGTSRVFRGKMYGAKMYKDIKEKETITDLDILKNIEMEKLELKKEKSNIQSLKVGLNKSIREQARIELYLEMIEDKVESMEPLPINFTISNSLETKGKAMVVTVSDAHVGKDEEVIGLDGEILNLYNFEVFKARMAKLLEKTIEVARKERVEKIIVLALGDNVDGILRYSQLQSLEFGIVDSVLNYSEYLATWINELSHHFVVEYHSAYGNHAGLRLLNAKSDRDFPNENVEKIIDKFIETRLANNPRVKIHNNNLPFSYFSIYGVNILAIHGREKNLVQTLKDYRQMYKKDIHMILAGHLHSNQSTDVGIGDYGNLEVIRVPSLCGIDDFSMYLHKTSRAGSKIFVFEENEGKTVEYSVYL